MQYSSFAAGTGANPGIGGASIAALAAGTAANSIAVYEYSFGPGQEHGFEASNLNSS